MAVKQPRCQFLLTLALVLVAPAVTPGPAAVAVPPDAEAARVPCRAGMLRADELPQEDQRALAWSQLFHRCLDTLNVTDPLLAEIGERAVIVGREWHEADPAAFVEDLIGLGWVAHYRARIEETRRLYEEAVEVARNEIGERSTAHARALQSLSELFVDAGRYDDAQALVDRAIEIVRGLSPPEPGALILALNTRARLMQERDRIPEATQDWKEALEACASLPGSPNDAQLRARILNNLGEAYYHAGDHAAALEHLAQARRIRAGETGAGRVRQLASTLGILAEVHRDLGDYPHAIAYYEQAVGAQEAWTGLDPFRFAEVKCGLARALDEAGSTPAALAHYRNAIEIQRAALRSRKAAQAEPDLDRRLERALARTLEHVGALLQRDGQLAAASAALTEALKIQERDLQDQPHSDLVRTLVALARLEKSMGNWAQGALHIERALRLLDALPARRGLAVEAYRLAAELAPTPQVGLALAETSGRTAAETYGDLSPQVAAAGLVAARLRSRLGPRMASRAVREALDANRLLTQHVAAVVRAFPTEQAIAFSAGRRAALDFAIGALAHVPDANRSDLVAEVWAAAAASRSLVIDAESARHRLAIATANPRLAGLASRLKVKRERLAALYVQREREDDAQEIPRALADVQRDEGELALASAPFLASGGDSSGFIPFEAMRRELPAGAKLVGTLLWRNEATGRLTYQAFVYDGRRSPQSFELGEASAIDRSVTEWHASLRSEARRLGSWTHADTIISAGERLRQLIWDPIESRLGRAATVYFVPDGSLNLVALSALPVDHGRYLIEDGWVFHLLGSERDLIDKSPADELGRGVLVVGDVDYDGPSGAPLANRRADAPTRERRPPCKFGMLPSLPATAGEVEDVLSSWRTAFTVDAAEPQTALKGSRASESQLREHAPGKRILHLATHGFATWPSCGAPADDRTEPLWRGSLHMPAGLAMAGANRRAHARDEDDGVLLVDEIIDLDLRGVEWVVLSACDTGVGTIVAGEGVFGLRRAFRLAGARKLVLSLWAVEDQAARDWMRAFYQAALVGHTDIATASQLASRRMLAARRRQMLDTSPVHWAAFVASGA